MKKLFLCEKLSKNKNRLKVQAVSLALAAIAVITTGCGKTDTNTPDVPKPGFEDVIDNDNKIEESMTPLTVENLDSEAEKLTNLLTKSDVDVSFEDVKATLLHLNKDSFTADEYYSLFEVSENEQLKVISVLNGVLSHNISSIREGNISNLINFKIFCRNENGYKIIEKFDDDTFLVAQTIVNNPKTLDSKIRKNFEPLNEFLESEQIKIGNELFNFRDLDDGTKILISYFGLTAMNYVNHACDSEYLTDETKAFCENIDDLSFILSNDSLYAMSDNTAKVGQKTK